MSKPQMIECHECHGSGKVELREPLAGTLQAIPRRKAVYVEDIHAAVGKWVGITAINNRLNQLVRLGFLERERHGKFIAYTRK